MMILALVIDLALVRNAFPMVIDGMPTDAERPIIERWAIDNPDVYAVHMESDALSVAVDRPGPGGTFVVARTASLLNDLEIAAASARATEARHSGPETPDYEGCGCSEPPYLTRSRPLPHL